MSRRKQLNPAKIGDTATAAVSNIHDTANDINANVKCIAARTSTGIIETVSPDCAIKVEVLDDFQTDDHVFAINTTSNKTESGAGKNVVSAITITNGSHMDRDEADEADNACVNGVRSSSVPDTYADADDLTELSSLLSDDDEYDEGFSTDLVHSPTPAQGSLSPSPENSRGTSNRSIAERDEPQRCSELQNCRLPNKCSLCPRVFKHKRSRDRHMKLHATDKKFRCEHCDASYARSDHLKLHVKSHDNASLQHTQPVHASSRVQCPDYSARYTASATHVTSHAQFSRSLLDTALTTLSPATSTPPTVAIGEPGCSPDTSILQHPDSRAIRASRRCCSESPSPSAGIRPRMTGSRAASSIHHAATTSPSLSHPPVEAHAPLSYGAREYHSTSTSTSELMPCIFCGQAFATFASLYRHAAVTHSLRLMKLCKTVILPATYTRSNKSDYDYDGGVEVEDEEVRKPTFRVMCQCVKCSALTASAEQLFDHLVQAHRSELLNDNYVQDEHVVVENATKRVRYSSTAGGSKSDVSADACASASADTSATSPYESLLGLATPCICSYCDKQLPDFREFLAHMETHVAATKLQLQSTLIAPSPPPSTGGASKQVSKQVSKQISKQVFLEQSLRALAFASVCCLVCERLFSSSEELACHMNAQHALQAYKCAPCSLYFDTLHELSKHQLRTHSSTDCRHYQCLICAPPSPTVAHVAHVAEPPHNITDRAAHDNGSALFAAVFHDRHSAEQHVLAEHKGHLDVYTTKAAVKSLRKAAHNGFSRLASKPPLMAVGSVEQSLAPASFQCSHCHQVFADEFHRYVHVFKKHTFNNGLPHADSTYTIAAPPSEQSNVHAKKVGGIPGTKRPSLSSRNGNAVAPVMPAPLIVCDLCGAQEFAPEADLTAHKKLHHQECRSETTATIATTAPSLKSQSQKLHHVEDNICTVSLQCAYCNEHCKSRSDLESHMKNHQVTYGSKGKYKCNICDEIYLSAITLADHKLSHCKIIAGNACGQCKAVLHDEQQFLGHQMQHNNGTNSNSNNNSNNNSRGASEFALPANCIICCQTLQTDVEVRLHAKFHLRLMCPPDFICGICGKMYSPTGSVIDPLSPGSAHHVSGNNLPVSICKSCSAGIPQHTVVPPVVTSSGGSSNGSAPFGYHLNGNFA